MNDDALPRGIRNNNPGNIERNATAWDGLADDQRADERFCVFDSAEYGIRALCKILLTYQRKYGLKTVKAMIERWAPPVENDTDAYVARVAEFMSVGAYQEIHLKDNSIQLALMAEAIIGHENGQQPYDEATIFAAVDMALA